VPLAAELCEVGSIKAFPLPVADEGNALMAQRSKAKRVPLVGILFASGTASVAPSIAVAKQDLADHLTFARCPETGTVAQPRSASRADA